jgi:tRNA U34 5-carboxymethylaminomethyl modifying GTPase MnmE/TrmE
MHCMPLSPAKWFSTPACPAPLQLIDARTVAAADSALAGLAGGVGQIVQAMRTECLDLLVEMDVR